MPRDTATPSSQDALVQEFQALVRETEKLLHHSASLAGDQADALRDDIRNSLDRAREMLRHAEASVREQGKIAVDATEDYVHNHPWQSLGVAAAIGVLFGLLISRS